jgi:hypothetical protein
VDQTRTDELTKRVGDSVPPKPSKLPGFGGYYLIDGGDGVMSSISFFETSGSPTSRLASQVSGCATRSLEAALPNPPKVTHGKVIAKSMNGAVAPL